jgi:hypothetical protein
MIASALAMPFGQAVSCEQKEARDAITYSGPTDAKALHAGDRRSLLVSGGEGSHQHGSRTAIKGRAPQEGARKPLLASIDDLRHPTPVSLRRGRTDARHPRHCRLGAYFGLRDLPATAHASTPIENPHIRA